LRFQPTRREAWLVDLSGDTRTEGDLCARHARGLVLPRGWLLHDERGTGAEPPREELPLPTPRPRRPRRRRRPADAAPTLPGVSDAAPEPVVLSAVPDVPVAARAEPGAPEPVPEPEGPAAGSPVAEAPAAATTGTGTPAAETPAPALPPPDEDNAAELDVLLDAQTPLLQRAFRNAWPR
jgi:hypothetical protein